MITFEEIKKDIKENRLKFFGSSELFDKYNPININEIIAITIQEYAEHICDKYEINFAEAYFRTTDSDLDLSKILKEHTETTGFYIDFFAPKESSIMIEIAFPDLDEYESLKEYIKDIQKLFINDATYILNDFDPDNEFDYLYEPNSRIRASELLEMLQADGAYFEELSEQLEIENIKNLEMYYKDI